tara:strand:+ start:542 stop:1000 length:459 start_codon:yes stop_codon:yes gene_type:complete
MEFVEFLDQQEIEIIKIIEKAGYSTEENSPICLLSKNYAGFLKKTQRIVVICTDNAKEKEGYKFAKKLNTDTYERVARHIKKALRHEAAHVAQECNDGKVLDIKQRLSLNTVKIKALKGSIKLSGEEGKEMQAYILEDKPRLLKRELKKYCL